MGNYPEEFDEYIKRMQEIRLLSKPDLRKIGDPAQYSKTLVRNFEQIGSLAADNRAVIDAYVNPVLSGRAELDPGTREMLEQFNELLMDFKENFEETDAHLAEVLNDLLYNEAEISEDSSPGDRVLALADKVKRDYLIIAELTRFINDDTEAIRAKALENHALLRSYL